MHQHVIFRMFRFEAPYACGPKARRQQMHYAEHKLDEAQQMHGTDCAQQRVLPIFQWKQSLFGDDAWIVVGQTVGRVDDDAHGRNAVSERSAHVQCPVRAKFHFAPVLSFFGQCIPVQAQRCG